MTKMIMLKKELVESFKMKDFGQVKQILGMRIYWNIPKGILKFSQEKYILKLFNMFNVEMLKLHV